MSQEIKLDEMPPEKQADFGRRLLAILQATDPEDMDPVTEFMIAAVKARIDDLQPQNDSISGVHRTRLARPKIQVELLPTTCARLDLIFDDEFRRGADLQRAIFGLLLESDRPMTLQELSARTGRKPNSIMHIPSYPRVKSALAKHNLVLHSSSKKPWSLSAKSPT